MGEQRVSVCTLAPTIKGAGHVPIVSGGRRQEPTDDSSAANRRIGRIALVVLGLMLAAAFSRQAHAADDEKDKPLPPEETVLSTSDGVTIAATFYPSKLKKAVPVILLHASKGSRRDFEALALQLQRAGHAVIVPDLRGHGEKRRGAARPGELRPADYLAMVEPGGDLETIKQFLMAKNNAGEVNIEKLCVVGVEMGAVVAINWAARLELADAGHRQTRRRRQSLGAHFAGVDFQGPENQ